MSDDRTQAPTRRRRQQAREAGRVAHSPELTAAAGLLAASVLLAALGDNLAAALVDLVRAPLVVADPAALAPDESAAAVVALVRGAAWRVLGPLAGILLGTVAAMLAVHQLQVGGLWAPGLLAPDPSRLIAGLHSVDPLSGLGRAAWGTLKVALLLAVAAWHLRDALPAFARTAELGPTALAAACGATACDLLRGLALALAALGGVDFALRWRRLEASLRMTPEEGRQDLREADGDPAFHARRRGLARAWRHDPSDLLPGAALLLTGPPGLAVLLAGGPPPAHPVSVRRVAHGREAIALRRAAQGAGLPIVEAPLLAAHLSRGPSAAGSLPPDLAAQLAAAWPPTPSES